MCYNEKVKFNKRSIYFLFVSLFVIGIPSVFLIRESRANAITSLSITALAITICMAVTFFIATLFIAKMEDGIALRKWKENTKTEKAVIIIICISSVVMSIAAVFPWVFFGFT